MLNKTHIQRDQELERLIARSQRQGLSQATAEEYEEVKT